MLNKILIMKVIDLSHIIEDGMTVFPGTPAVRINQFSRVEKEGYAEKVLKLATHIGTHMDAPAHMIAGGKTLDTFKTGRFMGKALVIPFSHIDLKDIDQDSYLKQFESKLHTTDYIILNTGWSLNWGTGQYFKNYPALDKKGAEYISAFPLKGVGIDAISIDKEDCMTYDAHHILLEKEILIIENLCNLNTIGNNHFKLYVFPLKIKEADGSPIRAVAEML